MKNKINIILVIVAYSLNFAHDIQPHEHFSEKHSDFFASTVMIHNHNNQSEHHHHGEIEHHGDDEQDSVPFPHHHLLQSHDLFQIRTLQTMTLHLDYSEYFKTIFCIRPIEIIQIHIFQTDEKKSFQKFIKSSLGLRAPPMLS